MGYGFKQEGLQVAKEKKVTRAGVEAGVRQGQVLLNDKEVKAILGRVPRTLTNMVVHGKRKLYRSLEVMNYVRS